VSYKHWSSCAGMDKCFINAYFAKSKFRLLHSSLGMSEVQHSDSESNYDRDSGRRIW